MGILEFFAAYFASGLVTALSLSFFWGITDPYGDKDDELAAIFGAFWPLTITTIVALAMSRLVKGSIASVRRFGTYLKNKWGS